MPMSFMPERDRQGGEKKGSRQLPLLILLLLILVFAYLYFFTGLIKPRPEATAPEQAPAQLAQVKKPLPPRPSQGAVTSAQQVAQAEKPATPAQEPAAKPAPAPAAQPAKPAPAAAPAPAKPAEAGKAAPSAPKAAQPARPAQPVKPAQPPAKAAESAKPAQPAAKPAQPAAKPGQPAAKPGQPAKTAAAPQANGAQKGAAPKNGKPATVAQAGKPAEKAQPAAPAVAAKGKEGKGAEGAAPAGAARGAFAVEIADLPESEVPGVVAKLKKAGVGNVVQSKVKKGEPMHRLYLADFADRAEAAEQLERLRTVAPSAFILPENGRYSVYAGSFLREKKAASEQDRLFDAGVKVLMKTATTQVPVTKVHAGSFPDKGSAEKALRNLKASGISGRVVRAGQ